MTFNDGVDVRSMVVITAVDVAIRRISNERSWSERGIPIGVDIYERECGRECEYS